MQKEDEDLEDEDLYRYARLVTSAVIAKVHTIDWTVELLKMDTLLAGMRGNWYIFNLFFSYSFNNLNKDMFYIVFEYSTVWTICKNHSYNLKWFL